jgi:hypothetical protein
MNKTSKNLALGMVLILTLSLAVGGVGLASALPNDASSMRGNGGQGRNIIEQIGEEAAQALHDAVQAMRDAGASLEEIRDYIHETLESLGVTLPEPQGQGLQKGRGMRAKGFMGGQGRQYKNPDCPLDNPETSPEPTPETTGSA